MICKFKDIIEDCAREYGLEPELIAALIQVESSFNERAYRFEPGFYKRYIKDKSKYMDHKYYDQSEIISASYGLAQILYLTFEEYGIKDPDPEDLYEPTFNIDVGCQHLKKKINLYGLLLGILAYNCGSPKGHEPSKEPNYVYLQKISKAYKSFGGTSETLINC
jgi:soluble lytic murein transglycosylase-like protein